MFARDPVMESLDAYLGECEKQEFKQRSRLMEEAVQRITQAVHKDYAMDFLKVLEFASGHCCDDAERLCKELGIWNKHFRAAEDWEMEELQKKYCQVSGSDEHY